MDIDKAPKNPEFVPDTIKCPIATPVHAPTPGAVCGRTAALVWYPVYHCPKHGRVTATRTALNDAT